MKSIPSTWTGKGSRAMTMKEVAQLAGVSSAAVSRYLNGGYISEDKAARIKAAIERTGYVPSNQARALRTGSTRLIGVIVPKINSESIGRITAGIGQVLRERGYQMLLADTDNDAASEVTYLELFQNHPVDGIILTGTMITPAHRAFLKTARVPVVITGQRVAGCNCICHDDRGAARELAERIAAAHTGKIAYIGVTRDDESAGAAREDGFREGLAAAGRPLDDELYRESLFSVEGGYACADDLLACEPDISFIACATDTIAAGAIHALAEHGATDAAARVSGFGDNQFLRAVTGGIATVHFGYLTSGVKAAQMLLGIIDGESSVAMQMELGYTIVGMG